MTRRKYTDKQLEEWRRKNSEGCIIDGRHYSIYEATQLMRQIETKIRKQKDVANIARASGDDRLRREAQKKITDLTQTYHRVTDASGLKPRLNRSFVEGFRDAKPLKNAVGNVIIEIKKTTLTAAPNSIT